MDRHSEEKGSRISNFANGIRFWRELRGINQTDAARLFGITQGGLSKIESGENEPTLLFAFQVTEATRMKIEEITHLGLGYAFFSPPHPRERMASSL